MAQADTWSNTWRICLDRLTSVTVGKMIPLNSIDNVTNDITCLQKSSKCQIAPGTKYALVYNKKP